MGAGGETLSVSQQKPKRLQRVCSEPQCRSQFTCYGECENIHRFSSDNKCVCRRCIVDGLKRGGTIEDYTSTYCESRLKGLVPKLDYEIPKEAKQ
jgi:hypothetical protein